MTISKLAGLKQDFAFASSCTYLTVVNWHKYSAIVSRRCHLPWLRADFSELLCRSCRRHLTYKGGRCHSKTRSPSATTRTMMRRACYVCLQVRSVDCKVVQPTLAAGTCRSCMGRCTISVISCHVQHDCFCKEGSMHRVAHKMGHVALILFA